MANNTYHEVLLRASSFLKEQGKDPANAWYLLLGRLNWSKTDWYLNQKKLVPEHVCQQLETDLKAILEDYPPQYILGKVSFYGEEYQVTPATLIPRPETEELVDLILKKYPPTSQKKVVDIGTGSGAIAIALKKHRPNWQVWATDISAEALKVARLNAAQLQTPLIFRQGDGCQPLAGESFDIIVSNPPYIAESERDQMDESVKKYEPALALFAAEDGLALYHRFAIDFPTYLVADGAIFLEIGYQQATAVQTLFQTAFPMKQVSVKQDLAGLDRLIVVDELDRNVK